LLHLCRRCVNPRSKEQDTGFGA